MHPVLMHETDRNDMGSIPISTTDPVSVYPVRDRGPVRHYVLVRTDIPIVQQIVQVGHVCHQAAARLGTASDAHLILLAVSDEPSLIEADGYIRGWGLRTEMYYDPDIPGHTAICTALTGPFALMDRYPIWATPTP